MYLIRRIFSSDKYSNLQYVIMHVQHLLMVAGMYGNRRSSQKLDHRIPFSNGWATKANGFVVQFLITLIKWHHFHRFFFFKFALIFIHSDTTSA